MGLITNNYEAYYLKLFGTVYIGRNAVTTLCNPLQLTRKCNLAIRIPIYGTGRQ